MSTEPYPHAWIEIDGHRLMANVTRLAAAPVRFIAVVKANGYGHGAYEVSQLALQAGAAALAVASPDEGIALRGHGITAPIHVLGALYPGEHQLYRRHGLTAMIATSEAIADLVQHERAGGQMARSRPLLAQLKVDTGMHRIGIDPTELPSALAALLPLPGVRLDGLVTHFARADDGPDHPSVQAQMASFRQAQQMAARAGWHPEWVHAANTAAVLHRIRVVGANAVRVGLGMYGLHPCDPPLPAWHLEPVLSLKARVAAVKRVPAGSGVSYSHTYVTPRETTLCTLPVGYADGVPRRLGGWAHVLLRGRRHPIAGRMCMDQIVVDVGDANVAVGEEAVLLGTQKNETISVDEWARHLDTIPYEIITSLGARLPRIITDAAVEDSGSAYWRNVP